MLHFSRWKTVAILAAVLLGVLLAIPNLMSDKTLAGLPDWMPKNKISLGLDLQGGVHLQVKVEEEGLVQERLETLHSNIRQLMLDRDQGRIGYRGISGDGRTVTVRLLKAEDAESAKQRLEPLLEPVSSAGSLIGGLGVVEVEEAQPPTAYPGPKISPLSVKPWASSTTVKSWSR